VRVLPFLLFLVVPVGVYLAYRGWKNEQARKDALFAWATTAGHSYTVEDGQWCERWSGPPFGQGDRRRAREVITGTTAQARRFVAFDYSYETHSTDSKGHRTTTTHRYAVTALSLPAPLPVLQVTPESAFSRLGHVFGIEDVELESEDFNRRFRVAADDRKFACDVLSPRLMEALLAGPELSWRIAGSGILSWSAGRHVPAEIEAALEHLRLVVEEIPTFVWKDHGAGAGSADTATTAGGGGW